MAYCDQLRYRDAKINRSWLISLPNVLRTRFCFPAKQSGRNEGILFRLWRKEIPKIPNIFTLFH